MLQYLEPDIFTDCTNLRKLDLSGNNVSKINTSIFRGLEQLEHLDFSNNNIHELNPLVFETFSISTNRHNHTVSKQMHLNLSQNKISSFNFELYFPSSTNRGTPDSPYELVSLNVSSNRLDSLDPASVRWLKHTAAVTDLSGNPWKCECSALGEAWRELGQNLTLICATPEDRRGYAWDVIEEDLCPSRHIFVKFSSTEDPNLKTTGMNWSSTAELESAGGFTKIAKRTTNSLIINDVTTILIVIGVLSGCILITGCIILVAIVKKLRDNSNAPQNSNVYTTGTSNLEDPTESLSDLNSNRYCANEHVYETVT
jgi:Leucine-rich repeat (LRR) protein